MQTPRILALADVQMTSSVSRAEEVISFYTDVLGLDHFAGESGGDRIVFRGYPRRGPHIVVLLNEAVGEESRRRVVIQCGALQACLERLSEARTIWEEVRGWAYYDRRICALDPAGNLVELVSYHTF